MMKKYFFTLLLLFIVSCDINFRCIDANDFGQPVSSPQIFGENAVKGAGGIYEYTDSSYTGYVLNGDDLVVKIKGAWSFNKEVNACEIENKVCTLSEDFSVIDDGYEFKTTVDCADGTTAQNSCWLPYGLGIYISFAVDRDDKELQIHLTDSKYYSYDDTFRGWVFKMSRAELETEIKSFLATSNWHMIKIYLEANDDYFDDNIYGCIENDSDGKPYINPDDGQIIECNTPMEILFLTGARVEEAGFLEEAARVFMDPAEDIIKLSYNAYLNSSTYSNLYLICSILFVIFIAAGYLLGFLNISIHSIFQLTIRFAIIAALLHPSGGWEFFDQYVVSVFRDGSVTLANMVLEAFYASVPDDSYSLVRTSVIDSSILEAVDDTILMFFSKAINYKMWSLLFSHKFGWLLILALYFAFYVFIFAMVKLTVIFIIVTLIMTILLSIAPIFFIFALFDYTRKSYFESWLKALIATAIQPMMLFVFIGIFLTVVQYFLYEMLYFEVCYDVVFNLVIFPIKYFVVGDIYSYDAIMSGKTDTADILVDSLQIDFTKIFLLFLTTMIIRYILDEIPKVANKIADGVNIDSIASTTNGIFKTVEYFGEEFAKTSSKRLWKASAGRTLSAIASLAPDSLSKYAHKLSFGLINKTDSARAEKAEKQVIANLKAKGLSDKEIAREMKGGALKGEIKSSLAKKKAKDQRYGNNSLNPYNVITGSMAKAKDDMSIAYAKAQKRAAGRRMTKTELAKMKNKFIKGAIEKVKSGESRAQLDKRANQLFDKKFTNNDLRSSLRELKDSGKAYENISNLQQDLLSKMQEKGYTEADTNRAIENDMKSSYSRIKDEFSNLKNEKFEADSSVHQINEQGVGINTNEADEFVEDDRSFEPEIPREEYTEEEYVAGSREDDGNLDRNN